MRFCHIWVTWADMNLYRVIEEKKRIYVEEIFVDSDYLESHLTGSYPIRPLTPL